MLRRLVACLAAVSALLAGCITPQDVQPEAVGDLPVDLLPEEGLWPNPQTTPHPSFGFPTLTHLPTNASPWLVPIEAKPLPATIAALTHVAKAPEPVVTGSGMTVLGRLAIVPGYSNPSHIVDISDPTNPVVLSEFGEGHRNADTIVYPDGRVIGVFAVGSGFDVFDLTDPTSPATLGHVDAETGGHKVNVVPGTPIVYNANSNGGGNVMADMGSGQTEIFDLSDPENPVLVQNWKNGQGCHHIYFWHNPAEEKYRAICAGIEFTQIWDTADPLNPTVIVSVPVHHGNPALPSTSIPLFAFSHFSILNRAGNVLIVGDEMGGGGVPPGCGVGVGTPLAHGSTPLGALWFYDVSDETNPVLKGWFSPGHQLEVDNAATSCTAHHGRLVPAEGRDLLAMAFYGAGVALVDFTDPAMPTLVDQYKDRSDTWEVQYYNGYLFTGDLARGMDVLTFE